MLNIVVLEGQLARPAARRTLPSGTELAQLEVTVRPESGPAEGVPVAWFDAPAWAAELAEETAIIVVGRVRRRFYQAGGSTQSRTEVVASTVLRTSSVARGRRALTEAMAVIEAEAAALGPVRPGRRTAADR